MRVLVTGGAGFIGSNLADALLREGHTVRIIDDLSAGTLANVPEEAEMIKGDVADEGAVREAVDGVEVVFHQAAHRAVLRSVEHPLTTDRANTHGTLSVLKAAADAGARRVVYASSSSVYGGAEQLPTPESARPWPRSPYAVSKLAGEEYVRVFSELYAIETVSLRYFNVYGARQRPDSAYAAVIPLFIDALLHGRQPIVHGDGLQGRDFTFIDDVLAANIAAALAPTAACRGAVYNVAAGKSYSLLELLDVLGAIVGVVPEPVHADVRPGDVRTTCGDGSAARRHLGWEPKVTLEEGLRATVGWFATSASRKPAVS